MNNKKKTGWGLLIQFSSALLTQLSRGINNYLSKAVLGVCLQCHQQKQQQVEGVGFRLYRSRTCNDHAARGGE